MLRSRIITGLVLAVAALITIYLLPLTVYALVFCLVGILGAYEYAGLAGLESLPARCGYALIFVVLAGLSWWFDVLVEPGLLIGAVVWVIALGGVVGYPASGNYIRGWVTGALGIVIMWASWIAVVVIRSAPDGSHWMLWLFLLVAFADIGAYFAGRRFGRHKLAPAVSPGKTWQGFWGGLVTSSLVCGGILGVMGRFNEGWLFIMVLLVSVSVIGDLFES
ncbi:MAG: phosphatidate cytidylyltransferase, partial [Pseudomonadales bacterium]